MTLSRAAINGIPALGFGTFPLKGEQARASVAMALEVGFRHIDTAQAYGNEGDVGAALQAARLPRGDVFVTTKVGPDASGRARFLPSVRKSLEDLRLDRVDLLLIHWPPRGEHAVEIAIEELNKAAEAGYARLIGISNFTIPLLERAVQASARLLATNQVEFHPLLDQSRLRQAAAKHDLCLTAYCAIARGTVLGDPALRKIAAAHEESEAAVVLRWIVQQGVVALSMSTKRQNAAGNFRAYSFMLSDAEMAAITALTRANKRTISPEGWAPVWDR